MNSHEWLLNEWGSRRYSSNPVETFEICTLLDGFLRHHVEDEEKEIKAINATQHNQLNIIDESEKVKLMAKGMKNGKKR